MKFPRRAPSITDLSLDYANDPEVFLRIMQRVPGPVVRGKYLHWDKVRHLEPPEGLNHHAWWLGLKLRRTGHSKPIPLLDQANRPFSFNLVDPLPECLHHADSGTRGLIGLPEPITNSETRDQYVVRSLIEESITSSQLEGASTTRDIAKRMIREGREPRDRNERMILNNYKTMREIGKLKGEVLTKELVFEIQRLVTDRTLDDQTGSGRFRKSDEQIVVGDELGEVFHTPPSAGELDHRMGLMCDFANGLTPDGFVHPVIRSMLLHFWLAYDHPFIDGNGRTARALFYWSMLKQGYWLFEFISISRIILRSPVQYGRAFLHTETDENDLTYFLIYHAEVVRRAIDELHEYIERRTRRLREVEAELRGLSVLNHRQRDLVSHAIRHPGQRYTVESHRAIHDVVYQTARTDLLDLAARGLLTKSKTSRAWEFFPVPDLEARLKRT